MRRRYRILGGTAALAFVLDQLSKWWVLAAIPEHRPVTVFPGFFDLINIRNRGAAFGFLNRSDIEWQFWLFLAATLVAAWAIIALTRSSRHEPWLFAGLGLVLGGALGNLAAGDRGTGCWRRHTRVPSQSYSGPGPAVSPAALCR